MPVSTAYSRLPSFPLLIYQLVPNLLLSVNSFLFSHRAVLEAVAEAAASVMEAAESACIAVAREEELVVVEVENVVVVE